MQIVTEEDKAAALAYLLEDPVRFAKGVLGHDVWTMQAQILSAVAQHRRVAVKACHASGKTFSAADAVLWWLRRFPDGVVVTTAPTWTQVERQLWGEIHKAVRGSELLRMLLGPAAINQTEIKIGPDNYAFGLSTNKDVRFQGFHGKVLIIIDEAPGVLPEIWEGIEGIRAGGDVRVLALGNPTVASGVFYDAFTMNRAGWHTLTISAFDTPNLAGLQLNDLLQMEDGQLDEAVCPYLTTRRWVREKHEEWGPDHPLWAARVMGQFPVQSDDSLISLAWLEQQKHRQVEAMGQKLAGVDVAGPGEDETVVYLCQGPKRLGQWAWAQADPRGEVVAVLAPHKADTVVNVDAIGIGYNFGLHLKDLGFQVNLVNVAETAYDREKFANRKAEAYWGLRERCKAGDIAGIDDERTIAQLASIRYKHNSRGQVVIESKEDMKKRGAKSPDRAEAVMLAYAVQPLAGVAPIGMAQENPWRM